ncbi:helix-turn-helix domain-containing protein [Cnuibacter physcomitrellae]|uniref:AraC-like ligand-binding domain-containing protein n=1 Tax=Cnuibacter physcomitrellae TaxID=1619308 RepID=UPI002175ACC9|nr:helix-turn-helix domain-containing protein [Cnuibacter physcomitrellae]MCS5498341.1 helix-turn-helix domain-containing protein [Cnuibacter physcomitrellae]
MTTASMPGLDQVRTTFSQSLREYRRTVAGSFLPLEVSSVGTAPFWGRLRTVDVTDVHVSEITATAHQVLRTPELIAAGDPQFYKASLLLSGSGLLVQDGRECVLEPGDLAIYDTDRPYSLLFREDIRMLVLMFPRAELGLPPDAVGQLTAHRFSSDDGLGAMIIPFLQRVSQNLERFGGVTGPRLVQTAMDLITTMFASELDLDADPGDSHQLLMQQIRRYIDSHLGAPDLGPARIAAAHYISTRHLHGLFREKGTTVSTWIREQRLERCRRDLLDPLTAHLPVGTIAARWGFFEAAHFSRVFKAAYDVSPSEIRNRPVRADELGASAR